MQGVGVSPVELINMSQAELPVSTILDSAWFPRYWLDTPSPMRPGTVILLLSYRHAATRGDAVDAMLQVLHGTLGASN